MTMPDPGQPAGGELVVQTRLHPSKWWLLVRVEVGHIATLHMVLDTGSPLSAIGEVTRDRLLSLGVLAGPQARRFVLRDVRIDEQPIADLAVRLSRRVTEVGADGVLGLDFLGRFTDIHFHVPTMRLTLRY